MKSRIAAILVAAATLATTAKAQTGGLLQIGDDLHRFLLRQQTLGNLQEAHLTNLPLSAADAKRYLDSLDASQLHERDSELLRTFQGEAGPLTARLQDRTRVLYANGVDFCSAEGTNFAIQVNPLLYASYGRGYLSDRPGRASSAPVWRNTRGIRASGEIGARVFFETRVEENQRRELFPQYDPVQRTAPRVGESDFNPDTNTLDYLFATGIVGYRSDLFEIRFGRDRNRWGFGTGSVLLSNFGTVFEQLQIRTTFWRLQYVNIFASLNTFRASSADAIIPKKYAAFHRLSISLPRGIEIGLGESVVFATDSLGMRKSFDLAYLNPIILYRAVEADRGSPDNILLSGSLAWTVRPGYRIYTELLLDELRHSEIGNKWWGNKWAWQFGGHFVPHPFADVRVEFTRLRPYLYAHREPNNAYIQNTDLLGHPAGPNATDWLVIVNVQPRTRWRAQIELFRTVRGRNDDGVNFGSDPTLSNETRAADHGVALLQGIRQRQTEIATVVSYELLPSLFVQGALTYAVTDDEETGLDRFVVPVLGVRWGLPVASSRY